jgi:single-stranded-DNA-specific exonuclease
MLLASSEAEAASVCQDIEGYNKERRSVDKEITAEALQCVKSDNFYLNSHSTVVWKEGWHKGVIGIVASRLIENYYKPTIVLTEKDGVATGSARSVKGLDIHKLLIETGDLLIKYGGHEMAAGLSIQSENLPEFRDQFEDITAKLYRLIHQFSPFGPKNMTPLFITRNVEDAGYSKLVGETKDHLKLTLKQPVSGDIYFSGIAFKQAAKFEYLKSGKAVDIVYAIGMNEWNGKHCASLAEGMGSLYYFP